MKYALVTGAAGFVGRHLAPLLAHDYFIYGVDPKYKPENWQFGAYFRETFEFFRQHGGVPEFDVVVHLAANIAPIDQRMRGSIEPYRDIALDWAMAEFVEAHCPKKAFVYMSSCAVDTPEDPYAWVKLTGEKFCQRLYGIGVPVVMLRPFSGYGVDQEPTYPFPAILKRVLEGQNPVKVWGSGYQVRDWIHVDDLARAIVWAIEKGPRGVPLDIGTGIGTNFFQLTKLMLEKAFPGKAIEIEADEDKPESGRSRIAESIVAEAHGFKSNISLPDGISFAIEQLRAKDAKAVGA